MWNVEPAHYLYTQLNLKCRACFDFIFRISTFFPFLFLTPSAALLGKLFAAALCWDKKCRDKRQELRKSAWRIIKYQSRLKAMTPTNVMKKRKREEDWTRAANQTRVTNLFRADRKMHILVWRMMRNKRRASLRFAVGQILWCHQLIPFRHIKKLNIEKTLTPPTKLTLWEKCTSVASVANPSATPGLSCATGWRTLRRDHMAVKSAGGVSS